MFCGFSILSIGKRRRIEHSYTWYKALRASVIRCVYKSIKTTKRFPKTILFLLLFYSTVAGVVPCGGRTKSPVHHQVQVIFYFLWNYWAQPGYFENWILLKPAIAGVCSLTNNSVAYEETQSNRVSDFRNFVCCFVRQLVFTFISIIL